MRLRPVVSLAVAAAFVAIGATGVLLFWHKHANLTAAVHTTLGAVFVLAIAAHVANNGRTLLTYLRARRREVALGVVPVALLVVAVAREWPGSTALYRWGSEHRAREEGVREARRTYTIVDTNAGGLGPALELEVPEGPAFDYPAFAVWLEDERGFVETLYVSEGIARSRLSKEVDGVETIGEVRRPEALPVWGHRRGIRAADGLYLPDDAHPIADAVTGATPHASWLLRTHASAPRATRATIYLEVNQSFDWNDFYSKTAFPDDPIYRGSGSVGQPSVVYAATIDPASPQTYYALNVVGHGHPGGGDGLDPDVSRLTTALHIVDGAWLRVVH